MTTHCKTFEYFLHFTDGPAVSYLQESTVKIVNNTECVESYTPKEIDGRVLCAGAKGRDTCQVMSICWQLCTERRRNTSKVLFLQGDSGGPLIFPDKMTYYLGGIVSYGTGCADPNYPGVSQTLWQ